MGGEWINTLWYIQTNEWIYAAVKMDIAQKYEWKKANGKKRKTLVYEASYVN